MLKHVINDVTVVGFSIILLLLLSVTALQRNAEINSTRIASMTCQPSLPSCPYYTAQAGISALLR